MKVQSLSTPTTSTVALPKPLKGLLFGELKRLRGDGALTSDTVRATLAAVKANMPPDYASCGAAFAYLYYAANFTKAYTALASSSAPRNEQKKCRILDLGCGSGASTAGVLYALLRSHRKPIPIEVHAVDILQNQLDLYERTVGRWIDESLPQVRVSTHNGDALNFLQAHPYSWNYIIVSYLLCELPEPEQRQLRNLLLSRRNDENTEIIVIDNTECLLSKNCNCTSPHLTLLNKQACYQFAYPNSGLDVKFLDALGLAQRPKSHTSASTVS